MPGSRPHHTDKWHSCVEKVMAQGHDESEASAICTRSLIDAGTPIFEDRENPDMRFDEARMLDNPEGVNQYTKGGSGHTIVDHSQSGGYHHIVVRAPDGTHRQVSMKAPSKAVAEQRAIAHVTSGSKTNSPVGVFSKAVFFKGASAHEDGLRELHLRDALGQARTAMHDGREHWIVPVVALMEGVIHAVNAETPERVTTATLARAAQTWNGRPVVLGHPVRDGRQCSANDPSIHATHTIGTIYNSRVQGTKLLMDAFIDPVRAERLGGAEFARGLREGRACEVSVGAFVKTDPTPGAHSGKPYVGTWIETQGDHLAMLPRGIGACSMEMGCGAHRAATMRVLEDRLELVTLDNPEGINQYTIRATAKLRGASMNKREKLREGVKALLAKFRAATPGDTPSEAASEEAAELIGYNTLKTMAEGCDAACSQIMSTIDELIADEDENPTETAEDEAAEEEVETARLESIQALCMTMMSGCSSMLSQIASLLTPDMPAPSSPRYMEAMRAAAGARNSAVDQKTIQTVHDHTMALGAKCDRSNLKSLAAKTKDCPTCDGSGNMDGNPCDTCDGSGEVPMNFKSAEQSGGSSAEGGQMTKEEKAAAIKALTECPCSGFKAADAKILETASDDVLKSLQASASARAVELKAMQDARTAAETEAATLKAAAAKKLTEEEYLANAPESIRALVARDKATEAAAKATIVGQLKTLGAYTEEELNAKPLDELQKMAKLAHVEVPTANFAGRGVPRALAGADGKSEYAPPEPYKAGLEALRAAEATKH